ncbi:MAG: hypothetical protein LBT19_00635 [Candidatus Nomurabacteria bacterium]|jgi:hypothetical protein|nr:hypothetical protein [Candidatus Nomurabacteria bacterium]
MSRKLNKLNLAAAVTISGLTAITAFAGIAPNVSAADETETEQVQVKISDNLTLDVIQPTTGDPNNIEADPETGAVETGYSDTYASTNNSTGATLTLTMVTADSTNSPKGALWGQTNTTDYIARLTGDGSTISTNQWGYRYFDITSIVDAANSGGSYSTDSTNVSAGDTATAGTGYWNAVPDFGSAALTIWSTTSFDEAGSKWVRNIYGAAVDNTLPVDYYLNSVIFTLSANPSA